MKVKLKDICEINPKDSAPAGDLMVSFIPMSRVSDEGEIDVSETRPAKEVLKGFSSFKDGDVLMAKITPCMENGKGCIARNLSNGLGYGSTEFHVIRPISNRVRREWIYYFIMHKRFRQKCIPHMTGSAGQKRVPKNYLLSCEIPLPTISIQDYIIRTLTNLRSIIHLRQSQLSKLDELVKCRFVEMFGDWKTNPLNLPQISGKELFVFSSGKFLSSDKRNECGVPVYGGNGLAWYTDKPLIQEPTIIIGRVGAFCGNIHSTKRPVWITDNAIYIKHCKKEIDYVFLTELMTQMDFHQYADFSGQPKITQKPLEETKYILPTLEQQNTFSSFVHRIDKLRFVIQQSLDEAQKLFDSLMQEYFD